WSKGVIATTGHPKLHEIPRADFVSLGVFSWIVLTVILDPVRDRTLRLFVVVVFATLLLLCLGPGANSSTAALMQQRAGRAGRGTRADTTKKPRIDYTNFSHQ